MYLNDYRNITDNERLAYLESQSMITGIPYFGGKSQIGKYLYNIIFDMAIHMYESNDKPKVFIDAFTGGGKMGLSMPKGWFDTIVMNDLDYGVVSFYRTCQSEDYIYLINMIDKLCDTLNEDMFKLFLYLRRMGVRKSDNSIDIYDWNYILDPIVAGAMTYVACSSSFNCTTSPETSTYRLGMASMNEKAEIEKIKARAHKRIPIIHKKLNSQKYIIENMDYKELIKKYNGKSYSLGTRIDEKEAPEGKETPNGTFPIVTGKEKSIEIDRCMIQEAKTFNFKPNNILWYFDPPYYEKTLFAGLPAGYADTFTHDLTKEMTEILANQHTKTYGELKYFIKSDYDIKETIQIAERELEINKKHPNYLSKKMLNHYTDLKNNRAKYENIFDPIEDASKGYTKICVGTFDKGSIKGLYKQDDSTNVSEVEKSIGLEYVWCHNLPKGYV